MKYKSILKNLITQSYKSFFSKTKGLRVFMYHSVKVDPLELDNIYVLNSKLFLEQMTFLNNHYKNNVIRFKELEILDDDLTLAITFDDGYSDNLYVAAPILQKLDLPFTLFITTDFVRSNKQGFLSSSELKEIASIEKVDIGSHSVSHPYLTTLSDKEVLCELKDSKHYLEDLLGKQITLFAYPHGDYDQRIRNLVEEAGYEIARNSKFSSNMKINDKLLVNSSEIWNNDSVNRFEDKINGSWDWLKYIQN